MKQTWATSGKSAIIKTKARWKDEGEIETLKDRQQEEHARLQIFEMTPTIEDAVALLRGDRWLFEAKNIQTEAVVKLKFSQVMYAEYLERNMFLYTKEDTYSIRISLANFLKDCPDSFVQFPRVWSSIFRRSNPLLERQGQSANRHDLGGKADRQSAIREENEGSLN